MRRAVSEVFMGAERVVVRAVCGRFPHQRAVIDNQTIETNVIEDRLITIRLDHVEQCDFWLEIDVDIRDASADSPEAS